MKIISGNLNAENIQMGCPCCHCIYELESRDDFEINWINKIVGEGCDFHTKIPEYRIKCPVCGYEIYIGVDLNDCYGAQLSRNMFNNIIMNRHDWNVRYKIEPRKCN